MPGPKLPQSRRRALIVDDEAVFRTLVAHTVETFGWETAVAGDAETASRLLQVFAPDIVLVDLSLGDGPTGADLVSYIRGHHPAVAILVLTAYRSPGLVDPAAELDDSVGYVIKADIVDVKVLGEAIEDTLNAHPPKPARQGQAVLITRTQADVLRLIAEGWSNTAIATERHCTPRSLERLISRLYEAMGIAEDPATNPRVLATRMYREGLVRTR